MTLIALAALICLLTAFQALFAGSEMALMSADRLTLRKSADRGNQGARRALRLLQKPEAVLATTLVGTNLCLVLEASAFTVFLFSRLGAEYDYLSVVILSPISLLLGEILPKTIFQRYAESLAPPMSGFIRVARWFFAPITWVLGRYTDWLTRRLRPLEEAITGRHPSTHREALRYLLTYGRNETTLKTSERKMIRKIFDFSRAEAKNALIALVNTDMIEDTLTVKDALEAFEKHGHSRLPVYRERVDNIIGVAHVFDVFTEQDLTRPITQIMQPPHYGPQSQQLDDLLFTMQKRGIPMAIVVDEYGGAVGVVTLEDILEEIVGEIKDEYDRDADLYREVGDGDYLIQAKMEIKSINELLKLELPHGDYETLAGFLLQQFNRIPEEGDELYFGSLRFVVKKATSRSIESVQVTKLAEE